MRILHECAWIRILPLNIDGGFLIPLYSGPSGVTRRQYLVNILLDVMVQDTGFTVKFTKNFMNLRFVQTNLPFFFLIKLFCTEILPSSLSYNIVCCTYSQAKLDRCLRFQRGKWQSTRTEYRSTRCYLNRLDCLLFTKVFSSSKDSLIVIAFVRGVSKQWLVQGTLDRQLRVGPWPSHPVVLLEKALTLAMPLSALEHKWVQANCQRNLTKEASGQSLFQFLQHEASRSTVSSPWMEC